MDMNKWIADAIAMKKKKAMPVLSFPAIQKMNITVRDLISNCDLQAEALKIVADNTDALASVSLMDLSIEAEAFGSEIRVSDDEVPTVIGALVSTEEEAENLKVPEVDAGRTAINVEAIRKAVKLIKDRPVFAGAIGPFSLAGRLMGVSEALIYCFEEPDMVHMVLEKAVQFLIKYYNAYKETGAAGIVMAEPLAGLLSEDMAKEFSAEYVKKIVAEVQTDDFIIVYHNCGNSTISTIDTIIGNGCKVFHFGNAIDMKKMMKHIPSDKIAMGNVDPAGEFRNGTPESVYNKTIEIMEKCSSYPNFIISSGCDIPPMSSWDNIKSFFKAVEAYNNR